MLFVLFVILLFAGFIWLDSAFTKDDKVVGGFLIVWAFIVLAVAIVTCCVKPLNYKVISRKPVPEGTVIKRVEYSTGFRAVVVWPCTEDTIYELKTKSGRIIAIDSDQAETLLGL
jgi:hypothetical protein